MPDELAPDPEAARAERLSTVSIFLGALSCASVLLWPLIIPCIAIGPMMGVLAIAVGWKSHKKIPSRDAKGGMLLGLIGIVWMILIILLFSMAFGW